MSWRDRVRLRRADSKEGEGWIGPLLTILTSIAAATAGWSAGPAAAIHPSLASPHVAKKKSASVFDRFNLCVANHEAGEPGSESPRTVDWHIVDPPYEGGYQWDPSTWAAAGGLKYGAASSASPENQTRVFDHYEPGHPSAWPESVPACGG